MKRLFVAVCVSLTAIFATQVDAEIVLYDFNNGGVVGAAEGAGVFDTGVVGDTATVTSNDGLSDLVLTVSDIVAPIYNDDFTAIVGSISAAAGDAGLLTNINGSSSLGIFNPLINNGTPIGTESDVINAGESISFTFDQAVEFTALEFEGTTTGDLLEVLVDGTSIIPSGQVTEGFQPLGGLEGLTIAAGSEVTFAVDGSLTGTSIAIETFTVQIVAVPEPASLTLLGLGCLGICARRKRR